MYRARNGAEAGTGRHGHCNFGYHITGVPADHGGAHNFIRSFFDINIQETVIIAFKDGAIDRIHFNGDGVDRNAFFFGITGVKTDVCYFRIGVGAPGNRQGT